MCHLSVLKDKLIFLQISGGKKNLFNFVNIYIYIFFFFGLWKGGSALKSMIERFFSWMIVYNFVINEFLEKQANAVSHLYVQNNKLKKTHATTLHTVYIYICINFYGSMPQVDDAKGGMTAAEVRSRFFGKGGDVPS